MWLIVSTVLAPPLKKPKRGEEKEATSVCLFSPLSLSLRLYFAAQAQVFITNDTGILLVPGLCRSVGDLSLHSVQSLLGCFLKPAEQGPSVVLLMSKKCLN